MPVGWTELSPGIFAAPDGELHISVPTLLEQFGWPDDAAHRDMLDEVIRRIMADHFPGVPVTDVE